MLWWEEGKGRMGWHCLCPPTLAWCRSTPYMESFLAFSRKWISASPGVIPLQGDRQTDMAEAQTDRGCWAGLLMMPSWEAQLGHLEAVRPLREAWADRAGQRGT